MFRILIEEFIGDLKTHRLRAFLTMFAVMWGTLSVVLLLSFGEGLKRSIVGGLLGAGERIFMVYGGQTSKVYAGLPEGRRLRLTEPDVELVRRSIPEVDLASPAYGEWDVTYQVGNTKTAAFLEGAGPEFEEMRRLYPAPGGRFINQADVDLRRRTVFLGDAIAEKLFGKGVDPVGKTVRIKGLPFIVVGVLRPKFQDSSNNGPDKDRGIIPYSTFRALLGPRYLEHMVVRPRSVDAGPRVKEELYRVLSHRLKFDPGDRRALGMWDFIEDEQESRKVGIGIQIFMGMVGALTLLVAGVGVANIMYVVVKERTQEIGVKLAVGARKRHIMAQFIFEAMMIAVSGGLIGLLIAMAIVFGVDALPASDPAMEYIANPKLSWPITLLCVGTLLAVGLVAGILPARRAARVDPIESLRYE